MAKINVATVLMTMEGEELVRVVDDVCPTCGRSDPKEYWAVKSALITALLNAQVKKSSEAYDNYRLASLVNNREEDEDGNIFVEFTSKEISHLQDLLVGMPTIIVGQVWGILEGKDVSESNV